MPTTLQEVTGPQTLQECVNHKFVADQFHMKETARDLMVKFFTLMLVILNLSIFLTVREIQTTMLRQTKLSHMEVRKGVVAPSLRPTVLHREAHVQQGVLDGKLAGTKFASGTSRLQLHHLTTQMKETSLGAQWTGRRF